MEYRQLYYFICIAREKSFSLAASKVRVSQSSLSRAVQDLEDEFNVQLINRTTRSFKLTRAGKELLQKGEDIVNSFEDLQTYMSGYSVKDTGEIRIGIPAVLNTIMAPLFIPEFNKEFPDVQLYFTVEGSQLIKKEVLEGNLDLGLVMLPVDRNKYDVHNVLSDKLVILLSKNHKLAGEKELSIEALKDESFILLDSTFQIFHTVKAMCKNAGFEPNIMHCSPSWDYIAALVSLSQGISILPRPITSYAIEGLVEIPLRDKLAGWNIAAITKKGIKVSPNVKNLIRYITNAYKKD